MHQERTPPASPEFFLVATPGLEDLVAREVAEWFPHFPCQVEHGGVSVQAPLGLGLAMNLALKTPTRILLRLASFPCRDFPKLFKKISAFPWADWFDPTSTLEVHASAARSRLKIKKRIEETCLDGWRAYQKKAGHKSSSLNNIDLYVRLHDNICTLSVDTSGERLHKRGARLWVGEAPLRETLAAALIQFTGQTVEDQSRSVELVDPLMGSGTILIEGAVRDQLTEARDFAFGAFKDPPVERPALQVARPRITALVGYELDAKTFAAAEENLRLVPREMTLLLKREDFFKAEPLAAPVNSQRWVIANPPYGERLRVQEPLPAYYAKLFAACENQLRPDRACFLLPAKSAGGRLTLPVNWKVLAKHRFTNGGIPVIAFVFGRKVL